MADLQLLGLIEPGEHSPTTTASLDEVVSMVCNPAPETPIDNLAAPGSAAPVAAEKGEPSPHSDQQEALRTSLEYPPQTPPHPAPLADSWLEVEPPHSPPPRNIIFFGETGVGKSAIINMLREKSEEKLDDAIAVVSNAALGCTLVSTKYPCRLCDEVLMLWDTAGLVEGEFGNVTAGQAEDNLASLLQNMEGGGVSLLVYCIRARRFRTIIKSHYELFFEKTCGRAIPIVLVVTGLENEEFMEDWWVRNEREFRRRGIEFTGHACITSTRGKAVQGGGHVFDDEYEESVRHLQGAILSSATSANVQIAGSKASSWAPWTSSMQKTLSGGWKRLGKIGSGQIVDDTAAVVYTTTGSYTSYPPQSARVPAGTDAVTYPVHSSAKSRVTHSGQHPTRFSDNGVPTTTHTDGAAIASLAYDNAGSHAPHWGNRRSQHPMSGSHFSITSAPGITPVGNAVIHHQPPPTPGLHSRLPQMLKRASDASRTPAPALTQTETAQPDQRTAGPHPPQQAADFHGSFYLDNGQGPVPFHQEASDQT